MHIYTLSLLRLPLTSPSHPLYVNTKCQVGPPVLQSSFPMVAQMAKNLLAMQKTWVQPLGQGPQRREWISSPEFLSREFHGEKTLVGYVHGVARSWT